MAGRATVFAGRTAETVGILPYCTGAREREAIARPLPRARLLRQGRASRVRTPSEVSVSGCSDPASMVSDRSSAGHCEASAPSGTRR